MQLVQRVVTATMIAVIPVTTACGADAPTSEPRDQRTEDFGAATEELVGSYSMRLRRSDLPPDAPHELSGGIGGWNLTISNSGGPYGRSFEVVNKELGTLEEPSFVVDDDQISLENQECAVMEPPGTLVDSTYRWSRSGMELTFELLSNGCPDGVMVTLLTANPWTRD